MTWIVMTSAAKMPLTVKARYRNVALVRLTQEYTAKGLTPAMISRRARGVLDVVPMGRHHVGKTPRCAYAQTLTVAQERAERLNNLAPLAWPGELWTWGGSA